MTGQSGLVAPGSATTASGGGVAACRLYSHRYEQGGLSASPAVGISCVSRRVVNEKIGSPDIVPVLRLGGVMRSSCVQKCLQPRL